MGIVELAEALDAYIPEPERALDQPFLLPIEDVFNIQGRGTVVTGRVERGVVTVGDEVSILGIKDEAVTTCTGVDRFCANRDPSRRTPSSSRRSTCSARMREADTRPSSRDTGLSSTSVPPMLPETFRFRREWRWLCPGTISKWRSTSSLPLPWTKVSALPFAREDAPLELVSSPRSLTNSLFLSLKKYY